MSQFITKKCLEMASLSFSNFFQNNPQLALKNWADKTKPWNKVNISTKLYFVGYLYFNILNKSLKNILNLGDEFLFLIVPITESIVRKIWNLCYFFRLLTDFGFAIKLKKKEFVGIYIEFSPKLQFFFDGFCESKFRIRSKISINTVSAIGVNMYQEKTLILCINMN